MEPRLDCDVLIAGAGPGGAAAAVHIAAAGLRVIVADWQSFPRDKVCGDFLSPVALDELKALGISLQPGYKQSGRVENASVFLDGKHLLTSAIPRVRPLPNFGRVIPRKLLDHWIVKKARAEGAEIREDCRVKAYRVRRNYVEVVTQTSTGVRPLRARLLIGADGSTSTIARLVRGSESLDDDRIIAVRGYFTGVEGPIDRADLYFSSEGFPGYCWLFPMGKDRANVGLGMVRRTVPPAKEHLPKLLAHLIEEHRALGTRLGGARLLGNIVGWPLTTYNRHLPVVADRVLLIGDAAGLINPLNGEGIQYALLSGRWAAEVVTACCSERDFSLGALNAYALRVREELDADLTVARAIVQLISNRSLNGLWLEALEIIAAKAAEEPEYAHTTGGVLAGVVPARNLLDLAVVRKTLEKASARLGSRMVKGAPAHPTGLVALGVRATHAAMAIVSPMLNHRVESERWMSNLLTNALDVLNAGRRN